ncbi:glycoside hydrolase family 2 TIM barrel-domain containing protein [Paenibacillus sp. GD4]|jgi:beta-galactosidase/beta-glucuronidase|uniref:glycoside hydrolase family 2 protein n=1 Tax=Paenibacillus sp. GD4 TaxID=3068890 RepID=UPI0027964CFB|nr:sugar-binding domain-containing protein [Paenibacillus sp. GD4]MDQ1914799.1 glycoside hydrolase family 2 TIM barrel-domain containing protein [Paenibacillus sp. GD4]
MTTEVMRPEYPRPQLVREQWLNLNGAWEFEFDDDRMGDGEQWGLGAQGFSKKIQVPFAYQSKLSGIGDTDFHDLVWYRRSFTVPAEWTGRQILLHFGAVDYAATVWVNGHKVAFHEGGHTPFHADITSALRSGDNVVVVRAEDFSRDVTLPRGKQYWKENSASIFYTRTTGIWQTVWLEPVNELYITKLKFKPDIDRNEIQIRTFLNQAPAGRKVEARIDIRFKNEYSTSTTFSFTHAEETRSIGLHDFNDHGLGRWWTPHKPNLYDVTITLLVDGKPVDTLESYFGMRKITVEAGKVMLNNRVYFMRLILDQGYFPDGILTAPSDEALKQDIELAKAMGFNGARKHQKIEDPRFLYWADKLGYLVWGEMANAYSYSEDYVRKVTQEWQEAIERDYNHPCIVVWVPINESWGVPNILVDKRQQQHTLAMYHMTKSLDETRLVVSNDGWENMSTDLVTIHDYAWKREDLEERYSTLEKTLGTKPHRREVLVGGTAYEGQPILVTEFGGIAFKKSDWEGWGYSGAENEEDFLKKLHDVVEPFLQSPYVQGICYTQLTDVEQEINGLLTYDRVPKAPLEEIKKIFNGPVKY